MRRSVKVFLVSVALLLLLDIMLCAYACYYNNIGPVYALTMWSGSHGFNPLFVLPLALAVLLVATLLSVKLVPRRFQIVSVVVVGCLVDSALLVNHLHYPQYDGFTPTRQQLDQTHRWLWQNPPNGKNRCERRKRMAVIQKACDQLPPDVYGEYGNTWYSEDWIKTYGWEKYYAHLTRTASEFEADNPALYYLRKSTLQAIEDVRKTRVEKGLVVWSVYNMGYVFKTPEACFATDIRIRDGEMLAEDLDFLLNTHFHSDHNWFPLMGEMLKKGKPVVVRMPYKLIPGATVIDKPVELHFGPIRIKVDMGDHGFARRSKRRQKVYRNFVLMFQIDCGESANNCTIYHTGDADNVSKIHPDKNVDIMITHAGMTSARKAIQQIRPRMTFVSHVLELGHRPKLPHLDRIPFDFAYRWTMKGLAEDEAAVLTWGERWLLPGTVLKSDAQLVIGKAGSK